MKGHVSTLSPDKGGGNSSWCRPLAEFNLSYLFCWVYVGEPPGTRTPNPQIKSLLTVGCAGLRVLAATIL